MGSGDDSSAGTAGRARERTLGLTEAARWTFGDDPDGGARACAICRETAAEWAARPEGKRFPMEKDWCWKAAERRSRGVVAPDDPRQCLSPCPRTTERACEVLDLVQLAGRQLRVGMNGVYGLDWNVIARLADDAGAETSTEWWELVAVVEAQIVRAFAPKDATSE